MGDQVRGVLPCSVDGSGVGCQRKIKERVIEREERSNMSMRLAGWMACVLLCHVVSGVAEPEPMSSLTVSLELPALSAYVWRGQTLNDEAVIQPAMSMKWRDWRLGVWGSFDLTDEVTGKARRFSEVDMTLSYERAIGPVHLNGGCSEYLFPNQTAVVDATVEDGIATEQGKAVPGTRELFLAAAWSLGDTVEPYLSLNWDISEADGWYAQVGFSGSRSWPWKAETSVAVWLGYGARNYNRYYFGVDGSAWNDAGGTLSVGLPLRGEWTLTPAVTYSALIGDEVRPAGSDLYGHRDLTVGSMALSREF